MNLGTSETSGNGNQKKQTIEPTKPSCSAEDLQFRKVTKGWLNEYCISRKLPAVTVTDLMEDHQYFYPQSPSVFRGMVTRDAYVNVSGLVKVAFLPEGRQPGNPFPFDPRPMCEYGACFHQFYPDQQEHIYIAKVSISHVGHAPPDDQVDKLDTLLQSMPIWNESGNYPKEFMPIGVREAAISFANYWNLLGVTCFSEGVSVGALLVAMSRVPDYSISLSAFNLAGKFNGGMKPPFVWLHRKWWQDQRMWGCIDESRNRPKKIKIVEAKKHSQEISDNKPAIALDFPSVGPALVSEVACAEKALTENKKNNESSKKSSSKKPKCWKPDWRFPKAPAFPGWIEKSNPATVNQIISGLQKIPCHPEKFLIRSREGWAKDLSAKFGILVSPFDVEAVAAKFGLIDQQVKKFLLCVPAGWGFPRKPVPADYFDYCI